MEQEKQSVVAIVLAILSVLGFAVGGAWWFMNTTHQGKTKTCTVQSAEYIENNSEAVGSPSVHIATTDCGKIIVSKVKVPDDVNEAKLAEVLNQHRGEKFEFVTKYIQIDSNNISAYGVKSLEPVE